jgi:hypothetical protein
MKFPGTELNIVLPPWPNDFDAMLLLERGLHIRVDKKTGDWHIRVDPAPQPGEVPK